MHTRLLGLVLFGITAAPLAAQSIEGLVSSRGAPADYALVLLVDSAGREVGATLSDPDGRFQLRAPAPGGHRVAVRRVGQVAWLSELLHLGGGVQPLVLDLPDRPVRIPDLRPEATGRCRVRPALGEATTALLDAARTGLGIAERTVSLGRIHVRAVTWIRLLDPQQVRLSERRTDRTGILAWPVTTPGPDTLATMGFAGPAREADREYYGPDARLLGTDWFLDGHCFDLVLPEAPGDTVVGVSFQPERPSPRPDVRGTLWVDRRTLGIRRFEFRWTGLEAWVPSDGAGADLGFRALPGGGVMLERWMQRAPLARYRGADLELAGWVEGGGEVLEVLGAPPAP